MEKRKSIGGIWVKKYNGGQLLSITITIDNKTVNLVGFKNSYKTKKNQPDYKVYESYPKSRENVDKETDLDIDVDLG